MLLRGILLTTTEKGESASGMEKVMPGQISCRAVISSGTKKGSKDLVGSNLRPEEEVQEAVRI